MKINRFTRKASIICIGLILLFIGSIKPVSQDVSQITAVSQHKLTGQQVPSTTVTDTTQDNSSSSLTVEKKQQDKEQEREQEQEQEQNNESKQTNDDYQSPSSIDKPKADKKNPSTNEATTITVSDKAIADNTYFTTNLQDGLIVTIPKFQLIINQLNESLEVTQMDVTLNEHLLKNFTGNLLFDEGVNNVAITMHYVDTSGKAFVVKQQYNVTLNTKDIIIQTTATEQNVENPKYSFTATAYRGARQLPLTVKINGQAITASTSTAYNVTLEPGKNTLEMTASDAGESETATSVITYEQLQAKLTFKTDLSSHQVSVPNFSFTAQAFYGDEEIDFKASLNGVALDATTKFDVELQNGTNIIQLQAMHNGEQLTKQYKIYLGDSSSVETKKDELAPTIKTDLKDGTKVNGLIKTINVWPTTSDGTRIRGKNVSVKVNGVGVPFVWDDAEKTSYKLTLQDGENSVEIRAWDDDGRITKQTYTVNAKNMENEVIGQVTISVEASVLGIPYFIAPTKVDIHQGEKGSYLVDKLLHQNKFEYDHTGTLNNNFYLSALKKKNMLAGVAIPDELWQLVEQSSTRANREDYDPDSLGEFDFANGAGWMYSVNGDYPNYGFSDAYFLDGDVVRIRFTLHYGKDIGGAGGMGGGSSNNWDKDW